MSTSIHPSETSVEAEPRNSLNQNENNHVHKVLVPPKKSLFKEFKSTVKETFFYDDPLRDVKIQPNKSKKFLVGIQSLFPVLEWGRYYSLGKLRSDIIAGLTIASLCIPQDIGYAKLANMDPKYGLYTSFVPPLVYACMGSSRDMVIGPVSVVSLLLGSLLQQVFDPIKDPLEYRRLAFTATFFAGVFQAALGFFRLGFLIDFLSHAAIVGFMSGAAITITLQQLKGFLGTKKSTKESDVVSVLHSVFSSARDGLNWRPIVMATSFLTFLLIVRYIGKRNKKLFWISAIAPLISVVVSTFFVYVTRADKHGIETVKHVDKGVNPSSFNEIYFSGNYLLKAVRISLVAGTIGLTEAAAVGRTFAAVKDYQLDGNKEMVALGTMNVVGSMTSCYIASGSFSRSAVNCAAGCQTAISNVVMSIAVLLTLIFITPLFKYTPTAVISAVIMSAVVGLLDINSAVMIWKVDKLDFIACMGAFFGVVFGSVEIGLLVAVSISFVKILVQVTRPRIAVLGRIGGTTVYRNIQQYPDAVEVAGMLIVRVDSAIYFSNSNYVRERILGWLREEEGRTKEANIPRIQFLIIEMSPVSDIDTSGIRALEHLHRTVENKSIQLVLANPGVAVMNKLHASQFVNEIGHDNIFLTVADAVATSFPKLFHHGV